MHLHLLMNFSSKLLGTLCQRLLLCSFPKFLFCYTSCESLDDVLNKPLILRRKWFYGLYYSSVLSLHFLQIAIGCWLAVKFVPMHDGR